MCATNVDLSRYWKRRTMFHARALWRGYITHFFVTWNLFFSPLRLSKSIICRSTIPTCLCSAFSQLPEQSCDTSHGLGRSPSSINPNKPIKPLMRVFRSSRSNIESTSSNVVRRDNSKIREAEVSWLAVSEVHKMHKTGPLGTVLSIGLS